MNLAKLINQVLAPLNVALIRKRTLKGLVASQEKESNLDEKGKKNEIERIAEVSRTQLLRHQISVKWDVIDLMRRDKPALITLSCPLCGYQSNTSDFKEYVCNVTIEWE